MKKNLTDLAIRKLKPRDCRYDVWDGKVPNFGVRVFPSGIKSFFLSYYHHNTKRRDTLGRFPELSLALARQLAFERKSALVQGKDPHVVAQGHGFATVLEQFLELHCARHNKPGTRLATRRLLENECLPCWGNIPVDQIVRADIIAVLDAMVARGSAGAANNCYAAMSKFFNWCLARGLIEANPFAGVQRPSKTRTIERTLTDDEIALVWQNTDYYPFGTIVRLLLLTGARRNEIASLESDWIDEGTLTIPAAHTKNSREHVLPLTPFLRDTLQAVPRTADKLFPARGAPHNAFSGFSKCKRRLDVLTGLSDWRLHDLRRTVATQMAALGVQPHIIERVLNHSTGTISGVAAIYNRHAYMGEMQDALSAWHDKIQRLAEA